MNPTIWGQDINYSIARVHACMMENITDPLPCLKASQKWRTYYGLDALMDKEFLSEISPLLQSN